MSTAGHPTGTHRGAPEGPELRALFANRAAMARNVLDLLDATEAVGRG